jgi:hypothetical protein
MPRVKRILLDIEEGKTYENKTGTRRRTVMGFSSYFVLYKTVGSPRSVTGVPMWDFKQWAHSVVELVESVETDAQAAAIAKLIYAPIAREDDIDE